MNIYLITSGDWENRGDGEMSIPVAMIAQARNEFDASQMNPYSEGFKWDYDENVRGGWYLDNEWDFMATEGWPAPSEVQVEQIGVAVGRGLAPGILMVEWYHPGLS